MIKSICIAGFLLIVAGCATVKEPTIVIKDNKEKDIYIDKIESIASDAGAGVVAVLEVTPKGTASYEVLNAQAVRLGGIKPPTVAKLAEIRAIIAKNDVKAAIKNKVEAEKVNDETLLLWEQVELLDSELAVEKAAKELALQEQARAVKDKILYSITMVGMAIFTAGVIVIAFTPKKVSGAVLIVAGLGAGSTAWIFDSHWFNWIVGFGVGFVVVDLLFILGKKTFDFLRARKAGHAEISKHLTK
jgi:hypothetical protein